MDQTVYQVKTEKFQGPLDVLLSLIEKKKLHISDVSLAEVTDDYISYIQGHMGNDLPNVTLFLSIAATLVYMKSKMLLNDSSLVDEDMNESSNNLEQRLKLLISLRSGVEAYIKSPFVSFLEINKKKTISDVSFRPHASINKNDLLNLANELISSLPEKKETLPKVEVMRIMSLEEMLYKITTSLKNIQGKVSFSKLASQVEYENMQMRERKVSLIVSFLAVLELMRGGILNLEQDSVYGDIICESI